MRILFLFGGLALSTPALAQDEDAPEAPAGALATVEAPATVAAPAPVEAPATVEAPEGAKPRPEGAIGLKRHLIGTGIEDNEPVGVAETFSAGSTPQLSCFMELVNPTRGELKIQVKWYRDDKLAFTQPMRLLPGPSTRTWARLKINAQRTGAWRCEVEDEAGQFISKHAFTVTE